MKLIDKGVWNTKDRWKAKCLYYYAALWTIGKNRRIGQTLGWHLAEMICGPPPDSAMVTHDRWYMCTTPVDGVVR